MPPYILLYAFTDDDGTHTMPVVIGTRHIGEITKDAHGNAVIAMTYGVIHHVEETFDQLVDILNVAF